MGILKVYKKGLAKIIFNQEISFSNEKSGDYSKWKNETLNNILSYIQPTKFIVSSTNYDNNFSVPVLTAGKTFILGYTNETDGIFKENLPIILFDDFTTAFKYVDFDFKIKSSAAKILIPKNKNNMKYIYEAMKTIKFPLGEHKRYWISEYQYMDISYPSVEEQQKIASILSSLDNKIETIDNKITLLKEMKKRTSSTNVYIRIKFIAIKIIIMENIFLRDEVL